VSSSYEEQAKCGNSNALPFLENGQSAAITAELVFSEKRSGVDGFSGRWSAVEPKEEAAAGKLQDWFGEDMLDGLTGDVEGDEGDDLNGLVRSDAERAVRVGVTGGVAVNHLHDSDHQHERDTGDPDQSDPGGACAQLG
jgi:hypothetical protein